MANGFSNSMSINAGVGCTSPSKLAYEMVQKELGEPKEFQVNTAIDNMREALDFNEELVISLLLRLEPVTGPRPPTEKASEGSIGTQRTQLGAQIETFTRRLREQSKEILWAIKALEI